MKKIALFLCFFTVSSFSLTLDQVRMSLNKSAANRDSSERLVLTYFQAQVHLLGNKKNSILYKKHMHAYSPANIGNKQYAFNC